MKKSWSSELVFTTPESRIIRHSNLIRRWWRPLLRRAAAKAHEAARAAGYLDYRFPADLPPYALRHSSDEVAALAGVEYDLISARMGHASLATTFKHYLNVSQERERRAADQIGSFIDGLRRHG